MLKAVLPYTLRNAAAGRSGRRAIILPVPDGHYDMRPTPGAHSRAIGEERLACGKEL
jgi:hypothetical protein